MKKVLQPVFVLGYLGVGLVQLAAFYTGLQYWTGWHWIILGFIAFFVGYIPVVGSIAGVIGAHYVWGWGLLPSILLFFWYVPLGIVAFLFDLFANRE